MQIDRVDMFQVRKHLINPFRASSHATQALNHIVIRAETKDGLVGWGECSALDDPYYMGETVETAWHILKDFLVPPVLGRSWESVEQFVAFYEPVKANPFAKAGIEMAAWDLLARSRGVTVASLLGGTRDEILSGVSLGIERDGGRLIELITQYLEEGYRRVKVKIAPGHDVQVVELVRKHFPDVPLMVDANSAYTLEDIPHLRALDPFKLMMIEQPLAWDDIVDHARLQAAIETPVCLDESIRTARDARHAIDMKSCRVINIKVARVGGLLEAKRIHDVCLGKVPVWCGGMHDYGIGRAANLALASLPGFSLPGDISGFDKYFVEDVVEPPILGQRGAIAVPQGPGLGHDVVEERIRAQTVRALELRAK